MWFFDKVNPNDATTVSLNVANPILFDGKGHEDANPLTGDYDTSQVRSLPPHRRTRGCARAREGVLRYICILAPCCEY